MKFSFIGFVILCAFMTTAQAEVVPSLKEVTEQGTTYTVRFKDKDIKHPEDMLVTFGPGLIYRGHFLSMTLVNRSFVEVSFTTPEGFAEGTKEVELHLEHLSAMIDGQHRGSPVRILINGEVFEKSLDPDSGGIVHHRLNITDWVQEGANTIKIRMLNGRSQYWLNSLAVTFKNQ